MLLMSFTKQAFWLRNFQPSCQECAFMKARGQLARVHLEQSFEARGVYHCLNFPCDELFWNFHNKSPVCDVLSRGEGKPPTIGMSETNQHIEAEGYICVCLPAIDSNVRGCKCWIFLIKSVSSLCESQTWREKTIQVSHLCWGTWIRCSDAPLARREKG